MIPPWLQPKRPERPAESAVGRDLEGSEKRFHLEILTLAIVVGFVWLVAVAFFALLFQSVWPVVVGLAIAAIVFLVSRLIQRGIASRRAR